MTMDEGGPVIATPPPTDTPTVVGHHQLAADATGLPAGFPEMMDCPLAWTGGQFSHEQDYVYSLSSSDIEELHRALRHFKALGLDGSQVASENFPLPTLAAKLDAISQDLHEGKGFGVIRGLDPKNYSVEDLAVLHLGIQGYLGDRQGRQDKRGNMMVHIIADASTKVKADHHRHSTSSITFHNEEAGDLISWLTRSTAASGGKCIIASAYTVYNVLAASRPDIIRTLARADWPFALPKFKVRPILFFHQNRLIINFGRAALLSSATHPRPARLPQITPRQMEALDAVEAIARATQLEIGTRPGDLHVVNNLAVLHRREGFVDGREAGEPRRHLVRMRLRCEAKAWSIPEPLGREWRDAFEREGDRFYHLEPMPEGFFPLRCNPN